jgi:GNAT superfamily N-acetyltransferase
MSEVALVAAREEDVPVILRLITALGEYERLAHEVVATEDDIREALFGPRPAAEVLIAWAQPSPEASARQALSPEASAPQVPPSSEPIGFALFFHNFSTFLGRRGLYLEDLFVVPHWRGRGVGRRLLTHLAGIAVERNCGRMEWSVLDWNEPAVGFYQRLGATVMPDWRICRLTGDGLTQLAAARES